MRTLALALVLLALACAIPTRPASAVDPYELNVVLSLTGPGTFVGSKQERALRALEAALNARGGIAGRSLRFVFYDDQTNPQLAVQVMNQLIAKKASVIVGPDFSSTCRAVLPLVDQAGIVSYCLTAAIHPPKGSYMFGNSVDTKDQLVATIRFLRERGWKRIAILTPTDSTGQDADQEFDAILALPENRSVRITTKEHFNPGELALTAVATRIKSSNPQALILWSAGTPFGTALHAMYDVGLSVPIATTGGNAATEQLKQYEAFMPKELYIQGQAYLVGVAANAKAAEAQRVFREAANGAGIAIDYIGGLAWDPAMLVIEALRQRGLDAGPEQIRKFISEQRAYAGISGIRDFTDGSQRGLTVKDVVMMRWNPGPGTFTRASGFGGTP